VNLRKQLLAAAVHVEDDAFLSGPAIVRCGDGLVSRESRWKHHVELKVPGDTRPANVTFTGIPPTVTTGSGLRRECSALNFDPGMGTSSGVSPNAFAAKEMVGGAIPVIFTR